MVDLDKPPEPIGNRPLKDTPRDELELKILQGHASFQEIARAKAEIFFRDIDWKAAQFERREHARTQAQSFQRKLVDDQIEAAKAVARTQVGIARWSALAASAAALAAIGLLIVSALSP